MDLYHWRALRYRKTLWASHLDGTSRFLNSWNGPRNLLLIGPASGYSLPLDWLARFEHITIVEPSWISRQLLALRLKPLNLKTQWLPRKLNFEDPGFLKSLPLVHPLRETRVLFANVLGQIPVKAPEKLKAALSEALRGVSWASYHDRFSSTGVVWNYPEGSVSQVLTTEVLIPAPKRGAYRTAPAVQEHLASDALVTLGPERAMYWDWQITPKQVHLIEGLIGPS